MLRLRYVFTLAVVLALVGILSAQVSVTGSINGIVTDPTGATVPSAKVHVINLANNSTADATTNERGEYVVLSLPEGFYRVEVTASGFRQEVVDRLKIDVATPATLNVKLEIGATNESVVVEAEATQVIASTATVGATVTGRQITELPLTSRDALDLILTVPGSNAGGNPRSSTVDMLPKAALNITMDGLNVMDNLLKSYTGGGMYTYIRPRIDAMEEFSVTTGANGADSAGEGAVQIKFVTARGTNSFHGGLYEYFRNTDLDANYWFNNQTGQPRQMLKLNQFGGKVGGPILKNKLFFFTNLEQYHLPESNFRQRVVLNSDGVNGIFDYVGTDGQKHSMNLLTLAQQAGYPSAPNAEIQGVLTKINALRGTGVGITGYNAFEDYMTFNTTDIQKRDFLTTRFDYNLTSKLAWSLVYNYHYYYAFPDSLNGYDAPFPGFNNYNGYNTLGGQISNRFSGVTALQWTISPTMTNEFRGGLQGGTAAFETAVNPDALPNSLRINFPLSLTDPINRQPSQYRNTPVKNIMDNFGWLKGKHNMSMGVNLTLVTYYSNMPSGEYPGVSLGVAGTDPVASLFTSTNIPFISSSDVSNAESLYALLTGRVSAVSASEYVNPTSKQYQYLYPFVEHVHQHEFGMYFQDNWRVRQNFTLNYGLRWEYQGAPVNSNEIYTMPQGGASGLWGISGDGNLFKPGTTTGSPTQIVTMGSTPLYHALKTNFAPSIGLAWSPDADSGILKAIFGKGGAFRAGYGIAFIRDGMDVFENIASTSPGPIATATLTSDVDFKAGSLLLGPNGLPPLSLFPASYSFPVPQSTFTFRGTGLAWAAQNLATPYVQSWSAGIQREILKDTILEVRYVGNHHVKGLREFNINETNIYENGFLAEFKNAQNNLTINQANGKGNTFAYNGLPGQAALPIMTAASGGSASFFTNGTFITDLQEGIAGTFANSLAGNGTYLPNIQKSYPANFFQANPGAAGVSVYLLENSVWSNYNSLQFDLRHRFTHGFTFDINYAWSKGLSDYYGDSATDTQSFNTVRNESLNNTVSPYDIRQQLKLNFIYELPFGAGKALSTGNRFADRIIGGWQLQGTGRIQSGLPFLLLAGRDTVNQYDSGIVPLVSRAQLQSEIGVYKMPNGNVYYINPTYIGSDGRANPQYLQPSSTPGVEGFPNFYLHGPGMTLVNLTLAKKTKITERVSLEFRAEAMNAFNNVNFLVGSPTASAATDTITSTTFGRITSGYNDISTTNDPGGRIIQLVARLNF